MTWCANGANGRAIARRWQQRSAGLDPAALSFEFRPLWQMDAAEKATIALEKAQATQVYAGLNLWPPETTSRLVQAQLIEDGIYPNAEAIFAEVGVKGGPAASSTDTADRDAVPRPALDFDPNQPRDPLGRWTSGGGSSAFPAGSVQITRPTARTPSERSSSEAGGILGLLGALNPIGTASAQESIPRRRGAARRKGRRSDRGTEVRTILQCQTCSQGHRPDKPGTRDAHSTPLRSFGRRYSKA